MYATLIGWRTPKKAGIGFWKNPENISFL